MANLVAVFRLLPTAVSTPFNIQHKRVLNTFTGGAQLTCIEDNRLTCDPNTLERGRPLCRLASEAGTL
jgi:hypothetical protein